MEQLVNEILQELFVLDPSFKEREAEMKKLIEKLIGEKPDTAFDDKFKQELRDKLLAAFASQTPVRARQLRILPHWRAWVGLAAAAAFVCIGFFMFQQDAQRKREIGKAQQQIEDSKKANENLRQQVQDLKTVKNNEAVVQDAGAENKLNATVPAQTGNQARSSQPIKAVEPAVKEKAAIVSGTAADKDNAPLPGMLVTLYGKAIGPKTIVTDEKGNFRFSNIEPGIYDVICELDGFKKNVTTGIQVNPGDVIRLNPRIELGVLTDCVTVIASAPIIDTKSAVGGAVSKTELQALPAGRNPNAVMAMAPGVQKSKEHLADATAENQYAIDGVDVSSALNQVRVASDDFNTEGYSKVQENEFLKAIDNPLSTFSIDVDTASYANSRRFLTGNNLPPKDAVRIEEFINYFPYNYPQPKGGDAFSITTEAAVCPWNSEHQLVLIGLRGRDIAKEKLPPSNLVFLLDVSGSMNEPNKLPLVQQSMRLLLGELSARDHVAIVVYAGSSGLVLPSTPGSQKETIAAAIDRLRAGGSTAGGEGIKLAYKVAQENMIKGGNNRVILATDGDFNIGPSSDAEMERLIEAEREKGVFLTILGFGMDNLKDSKMLAMADKGNGNYAYIDSIMEAKKVLVNDVRKTLFTIAKDVKIQVEFNPALIGYYRLIGYEKRLLKKEDFNDDTKDAGEIGAGHTVTALYEVVPHTAGVKTAAAPLKYQQTVMKNSADWLTVNIRYKQPDGNKSALISQPLVMTARPIAAASETMRFASAVTQFAMLLRDSKFKGSASYDGLLTLAKGAIGPDSEGYRGEFLRLVEVARLLDKKPQPPDGGPRK